MGLIYRILAVAALVVLGLVAVLMPARHGWLPLWPVALVEVIEANEAGDMQVSLAELLAKPAHGQWQVRGPDGAMATIAADHDAVTVVSRPDSAVVLEDRAGARHFGYLIGAREEENGPLTDNAAFWLKSDYVRFGGAESVYQFVFQYPHGETVEFQTASLDRYYRPNRMGRADKFRLLLARLRARWSENA